MKRQFLITLMATTFVFALATVAFAHTISIGYENAGPGSVSFWYGSYHLPSETPAFGTEGSLNLVGINGNPFASTTVPFDMHVSTKPGGLIDGTTNFYATNSNTLSATNTLGLTVARWQGVTFGGLAAGDYQFTYIPIASPSATWAPWNDAVRTNTVTLSGAIVGAAVPEPGTMALFAAGLIGLLGIKRKVGR
jgi:PEP-CTERM motif